MSIDGGHPGFGWQEQEMHDQRVADVTQLQDTFFADLPAGTHTLEIKYSDQPFSVVADVTQVSRVLIAATLDVSWVAVSTDTGEVGTDPFTGVEQTW